MAIQQALQGAFKLTCGVTCGVLVAACAAPPPSSTDKAPEKAIGVTGTGEAIGAVDLVPHALPGAPSDYVLRARTVVIAPEGAIQAHPHAGRPGIVRVVKGTVYEYRGTTSRTLKVGDYWFENADTVHWFRNPSTTETAELWVVDIVKK